MLFLTSTKRQLVTSVSVSEKQLQVPEKLTLTSHLELLMKPWTYISMFHTEPICYDDACHLKKYATHKDRKVLTATAGRITSMTIVVDKLHFRGHTDKWCQEFCNPYKFDELNQVRFIEH